MGERVIPKWAAEIAAEMIKTYGDDQALLEGAIAGALVHERERCAIVARRHAAGRTSQSANARANGHKTEAHDFQTMAISASQIADDIARGEG